MQKSIAPKINTARTFTTLLVGRVQLYVISLTSVIIWVIWYSEKQSARITKPRNGEKQIPMNLWFLRIPTPQLSNPNNGTTYSVYGRVKSDPARTKPRLVT
jgi:hypothetical protein